MVDEQVGTRRKVVAIYARVSTADQTCENQLRDLRSAAERHGWVVAREFVDHGISGAKGREGRPQFEALHKAIARKEIEMVLAWSVDRLGRSLKDLVAFLSELQGKGVGLYLHQQGVDTSTPAGKALFSMMGVFAEFERAIITERVRAGIARSRPTKDRWGRPPLAVRYPDKAQTIQRLRSEGRSMHQIARAVGVSSKTVWRILQQA